VERGEEGEREGGVADEDVLAQPVLVADGDFQSGRGQVFYEEVVSGGGFVSNEGREERGGRT